MMTLCEDDLDVRGPGWLVGEAKLLSTWWTTARVHRTSQAANALDWPTVTSWWFHNTVASRLVVGLSPLRVRWNWTRFHTHSGPPLGVPTASNRRWKLIFFRRKGTFSALEALHDALCKSIITTTITTTTFPCEHWNAAALYIVFVFCSQWEHWIQLAVRSSRSAIRLGNTTRFLRSTTALTTPRRLSAWTGSFDW